MSNTDDYIHAIKQFEKLRHEYLEWLAETDHVLNILRRVDISNTDWAKVLGDQLCRGGRDASEYISSSRSLAILEAHRSTAGETPSRISPR